MPYYMKQRQKNLIFASNSLEQISARSNSTSLVSYPPGFQPVRSKKAGAGGNALRSHYELSRVHVGVDGTGSSNNLPAEARSSGSYQDTGYFGKRTSNSPITGVRKGQSPPKAKGSEPNPYDISRKIHIPNGMGQKSEPVLPALSSGKTSPQTKSFEQKPITSAGIKQQRHSFDSPIIAQQYQLRTEETANRSAMRSKIAQSNNGSIKLVSNNKFDSLNRTPLNSRLSKQYDTNSDAKSQKFLRPIEQSPEN